jgi:hypothetical protein
MGRITDIGDSMQMIRTSRTDWRVVDARALLADPGRILGFIERIGHSRYEILWASEPPRWDYVTSLPRAVDVFAAESSGIGKTESFRTVEQTSRAEKRFRFRFRFRSRYRRTLAATIANVTVAGNETKRN